MAPRPFLRLLALPPTVRKTGLVESWRFGFGSCPSTFDVSSSWQSQLQWRGNSVRAANDGPPGAKRDGKAAQKVTAGRASQSSPRWLSEVKERIGKCITFGLNDLQIREAAGVVKILGEEWRSLVAGCEGFLTNKRRAGLLRHQVVWGEMDSMAHVNNVTYTRYAESARIQWAQNFALHVDQQNSERWGMMWTPHGMGLILRSIKTEYKFPMVWPDRVSVFHKLRKRVEEGEEGFWLDVLIVSEGKQRVAARCEEDIVVYDYQRGRKGGVEGWMSDAFQRVWEEQERERERVVKRVQEVEELVGGLEVGTWDREGAVEDMGSR